LGDEIGTGKSACENRSAPASESRKCLGFGARRTTSLHNNDDYRIEVKLFGISVISG